jgi:hypothetical protein
LPSIIGMAFSSATLLQVNQLVLFLS